MTLRAGTHHEEVASGDRFAFGKNWAKFLTILNEDRIALAVRSVQENLGLDSLDGKTFLDVGSGSGLFSLAARRLRATVHSFDYDPDSVACTGELKRRFYPNDRDWIVEQGSALDGEYLRRLGKFDVVYSWGVLHHTGSMWTALENVRQLVAPGGLLSLALYNNQGGASRRWLRVKQIYNRLPRVLKPVFAVLVYAPLELRSLAIQLVRGRPQDYFLYIANYDKASLRGMNWLYDKIDWVGGLPFEVSKPEEIFDFYKSRGFVMDRIRTCGGGLGCNEFVFRRAQ